jgi:hypothetical protein
MTNGVMRLSGKVGYIHNLLTSKLFRFELECMDRSTRLKRVLARYWCILCWIRQDIKWIVLGYASHLNHEIVDGFDIQLSVQLIREWVGSFVAAPLGWLMWLNSEKPKTRMCQPLFAMTVGTM